ncbi:MAG: transposase, partial [Muribaculaceae bacterium]|nr:transposase [Muribaculaceae bacterium]
CKHAAKGNGLHDLMEIMIESMMVAERGEFLADNPGNKGNGCRPGSTYGHGRKLEFRIPRDRYGNFHPQILAILRDQEEGCDRLAGVLYTKGLTQEQAGDVFDRIYGQHYSKAVKTRQISIFALLNDGLPDDMPMATNTKMLYAAYYLFDKINNKTNIVNEFIIPNEKKAFEHVKKHVLENCNMLDRTPQHRKAELGNIVFDKICKQLRDDIELCSNRL